MWLNPGSLQWSNQTRSALVDETERRICVFAFLVLVLAILHSRLQAEGVEVLINLLCSLLTSNLIYCDHWFSALVSDYIHHVGRSWLNEPLSWHIVFACRGGIYVWNRSRTQKRLNSTELSYRLAALEHEWVVDLNTQGNISVWPLSLIKSWLCCIILLSIITYVRESPRIDRRGLRFDLSGFGSVFNTSLSWIACHSWNERTAVVMILQKLEATELVRSSAHTSEFNREKRKLTGQVL